MGLSSIKNIVLPDPLLSDPLVDAFHEAGILLEEEIQGWIREEVRNSPSIAFRLPPLPAVYVCDDGIARTLRDAAVFQMSDPYGKVL